MSLSVSEKGEGQPVATTVVSEKSEGQPVITSISERPDGQPIMTVVQITDGQVQASSAPAVSEISDSQGSSRICSSCVREERGPTRRQMHALGGDDGKSNPRTRVNAPRK